MVGSITLPEDLLFVGLFNQYIRRIANWFTIDMLVTLMAIGLTGLIWRTFEPLNVGWLRASIIAFTAALLFSLTKALMGVNRIAWSKASFADAYELFPPWLIAFAILFLVNLQASLLPWAFVVVASVIAFAGFVVVRYRSRLITAFLVWILRHEGSAQTTRERVLIVGSGRTAEHIAWLLDHPRYAKKFQVVGFVEDDLLDKGMRIYGARVVGNCQDLPVLVNKYDVGLILLADHRITYKEYRSITKACDAMPAKILFVPDLFGSLDSLDGATPVAQLDGSDGQDKTEFRCQRCLARTGAFKPEDKFTENYEI
jgi:FlaA1/EpsC-like NDP-sugar epimerase